MEMNRIAIFQLGYEANTFIEGRAELEDLGMGGWTSGSTVEELFWGGRAEEYDGVCIGMHGAGCADGFHDADGYLLKRVRQVVGDKPVMASLDLHGNITGRNGCNGRWAFGD